MTFFGLILLYLDPGSGAILAQVLAAVAGGLYLFKEKVAHIYRQIRSKFRKQNEHDNKGPAS